MPQCVTDRLMQYLTNCNPSFDARYRDIAALYKRHGEALAIRWDYAFFQTLLETNNLTFTVTCQPSRTTSPAAVLLVRSAWRKLQGRVGVLAQIQAPHSLGQRVDNSGPTRTRPGCRPPRSRSRSAGAVRFSISPTGRRRQKLRWLDDVAMCFRRDLLQAATGDRQHLAQRAGKRRRPKARRTSAAHRPRPASHASIWLWVHAVLPIRPGDRLARSITRLRLWPPRRPNALTQRRTASRRDVLSSFVLVPLPSDDGLTGAPRQAASRACARTDDDGQMANDYLQSLAISALLILALGRAPAAMDPEQGAQAERSELQKYSQLRTLA